MSQTMSLPPELSEKRTKTVRSRFLGGRSAGRGIVEVIPRSELMPMKVLVMGLCLSLSCGMASTALAFDPDAGITKESGPFDLFKFGFFSYKEGRKGDAVEAYRYAAEKGHTGSRWALANMYADGDGVPENDLEAFKIYSEIARAGVEPGSEDTGYFASALISLASYYRRGIPDSPVRIDLTQARQLYFQAASTFGIPEAQFQLGRMMLRGEGGNVSVHQAKKWLNRARNKGHAGAMGLFGNILFQEGDTARGLAFMTAALDHCPPKDCGWLQATQEEAFSVATEEDRRKGVALAQSIRFNPNE
jgi:TPR repeat protein